MIKYSTSRTATFIVWSLLALIAGTLPQAFAQSSDETWVEPLNLSESGAISDPQLVVGPGNVFHVIWQDVAANSFIHSRSAGGDWSDPVRAELPFGTRRFSIDLEEEDPTPLFTPVLASDFQGRIHAVWPDEDGILYHSSVPGSEFTDFDAWSPRQSLAGAGIGMALAVDADGILHLAYIRPLDTDASPAGVYYQQSIDGGETWTDPLLLYDSTYYHLVPEEQTNVQISTSGSGARTKVYVVWDNRSLEKVYVAASTDSGLTWDRPRIVDQREAEDSLSSIGPSNIRLVVIGQNVHLVWLAGHDSLECAQYHLQSLDGGESWQERQRISTAGPGCSELNQLIDGGRGQPLLLTTHQGQPALLAWDGDRWSEPQLQETLSTFISSETFRQIELGCHQAKLVSGDRLLVVACSLGENEDVWATTRTIGPVDGWFPQPAIWSEPHLMSSGNRLATPVLVSDEEGRLHAFWSQQGGSRSAATAIYYARWDEMRWTQPSPVLTSPIGDAEGPAAAVGSDGRLLVAWIGGSGNIYYSQASASQAIFSSDWSLPMELPSSPRGVSSIDIAIDQGGTIYLLYTVPLNEERGIYLTTSRDSAQSWSDPMLVFDGASAEWEMVGDSHLSITGNSHLHLIWAEHALPSSLDTPALALYYARSEDRGETFSRPQTIVKEPVNWSQSIGQGFETLYRLWQETRSDGSDLRLEQSADSGMAWSSPVRTTSEGGPATVALDSSGQLHLVQEMSGQLGYRFWNGTRWNPSEGLSDPQLTVTGDVDSVASAITSNNNLLVVFMGQDDNEIGGQEPSGLYSAYRPVELAESPPPPLPTVTSTPEPAPTATATALPLPTPTIGFLSGEDVESSNSSQPLGFISTDSGIVRFAVGFLPAVLFVAVVFALGLRAMRAGRR